jgi:hypothetical protein
MKIKILSIFTFTFIYLVLLQFDCLADEDKKIVNVYVADNVETNMSYARSNTIKTLAYDLESNVVVIYDEKEQYYYWYLFYSTTDSMIANKYTSGSELSISDIGISQYYNHNLYRGYIDLDVSRNLYQENFSSSKLVYGGFYKGYIFLTNIVYEDGLGISDNFKCDIVADNIYFISVDDYQSYRIMGGTSTESKSYFDFVKLALTSSLDYYIDSNGNIVEKETLQCPSNVYLSYMNNLGSNYVDTDYGNIESEIYSLWFYPEDVLGTTVSIEYIEEYHTIFHRLLTTTEKLKHPTYATTESKQYPTTTILMSKKSDVVIPANIEDIPNVGDVDHFINLPNVVYDEDTNKIRINYIQMANNTRSFIVDYINDIDLKIGVAEPVNQLLGYDKKNKYSGIGTPISVIANCVITSSFGSTPEFTVKVGCSNSAETSVYTTSDGSISISDNDDDTIDAFMGMNSDGSNNGYLSDDEYNRISQGMSKTDYYGYDTSNDVDMNFSDSVSWFKSLIKTMKEFPSFFIEFFEYIPYAKVVGQTLMALLVIALVVAFVKIII